MFSIYFKITISDIFFLFIINENIICASTGLWGSSNESLNWEEKDTGDITFGW